MDNEAMKNRTELVEGPEAWKRFEGVMKNVLVVTHSEIQRRIKEQSKKAAGKPHQNGNTKSKPADA